MKNRSFVLVLEELESRQQPSCLASEAHHQAFPYTALRLDGDAGPNNIALYDTGAGFLIAICDGIAATYKGWQAVDIYGGAGDDQISYVHTSNSTTRLDYDFNLGSGDDRLKIDLSSRAPQSNLFRTDIAGFAGTDQITIGAIPKGPATLAYFATLGDGDDILILASSLSTGKITTSIAGGAGADQIDLNATKVATGSTLIALADGQDNADSLTGYAMAVGGDIKFGLFGGTGDDQIYTRLTHEPGYELRPNITGLNHPPLSGTIHASLVGDNGADSLSLRNDLFATALPQALLFQSVDFVEDGRAGSDRCLVSSLSEDPPVVVAQLHCESKSVISGY